MSVAFFLDGAENIVRTVNDVLKFINVARMERKSYHRLYLIEIDVDHTVVISDRFGF